MLKEMNFRKFKIADYPKIFGKLRVRELNSTKDKDGYLIVYTKSGSKNFHQDDQDIFIVRNSSPYEHMIYVLPNDKMII